jgi:ABC-type branched-subunit amino acid transport system substrate-binding protein
MSQKSFINGFSFLVWIHFEFKTQKDNFLSLTRSKKDEKIICCFYGDHRIPHIVSNCIAADAPLYVVINKSADQQYFIDLQNAFVAKTEELGGTAKKFDAKLDPALGVSLIDDAISAGAKGIAITVPDQTIGPAIAKAAKDAGVSF